jgi:hypothetical protein
MHHKSLSVPSPLAREGNPVRACNNGSSYPPPVGQDVYVP